MRILESLLFLTFIHSYLVAASSYGNYSSKPVPGCAAPCILNIALGEGKCMLENYAPCYCSNVAMQRSLSACVRTNCSIEDQTIASALGQDLCRGYPVQTRAGYILSIGITFFGISMVFLGLRVYTRYRTLRKLWPDDYVALFSGACLVAAAAIELYAIYMGYGKHLWSLPIGKDVYLLKALFALQVFYIIIQSLSKISLLLMFKRIYPSPRFRLCCDLGIAFVALHCVAFTIAVVFQCYPINAYWDLKIHGKCLNTTAIAYTGATFSIVEDFIILCMPIPQVLRLQVKRGQKIALLLLFSVGSFACIVSIVRLKYINSFKPSSDLTWDNADLLVWSLLEVEMTLICACLPTLRPLFVEILPSAWRTTLGSNYQNTNTNQNSKLYSCVESRKQYSDLNVSCVNDLHDQPITITTTIETYLPSSESSKNPSSDQVHLKDHI